MSDTDSEEEGKQKNDESRKDGSTSESEDETSEVRGVTLVELIPDTCNKMAAQQPLPRRKRFIPKYEIEGVYKLVLGEETQVNIEMVIGTHVNAQFPWKSVSKEKLLEQIENSGEESEFFPLKEALTAYKESEVLMGYIVDESKDDDEFYVCCTIEARDHCKQQSDKFIRRQEKKLEKAVQRKPRPWKSLGSEAEIKELIPINTRPLIELEVRAKFPTEYEPERFFTRDSNNVRDGYVELTPYRQKFNIIFKKRVDIACQASPATSHRAAQTVLRYPKNMWTQATADPTSAEDSRGGGDTGQYEGDKKVDSDEEEEAKPEAPDEIGMACENALKRMHRASYVKLMNTFMSTQRSEMDSIVELNTVMDIYCNDYPILETGKKGGIYDSMAFEEYVCFTDVRAKQKYVSCAVFHPMWSGIVAICYSDGSPSVMKSVSSRPDPIARAVYGLNPVMIWSHIDSLIPKLYLESPREVTVLSFCPFDENILVGGCINGQIILWDLTNKLDNVESIEVLSETREKYRIAMNAHMGWMKSIQDNAVVATTVLSNLMTSHYGSVNAIMWLPPNFTISPTGRASKMPDGKTSMIFMSGSEDGVILIWNLSVENVTVFEGKKVKKSKRVLKRPSGLLTDVSPYKVLDRNLQPCFKINIGIAGQPLVLPLQCFAADTPQVDYVYTPRNTGSGRKYFSCKIREQTMEDLTKIIYCGSSHGEIIRMSWAGHEFNTGEVVNSEYCTLKYSCCLHDGVITRTIKNPFVPHITLTVGGKIFAIWSDQLMNRPLIWKKRPFNLTDASWSQYKASLLFIATSEGTLETWDLLLRSDQPISSQALSGTTLTGVSLHTLPLAKNILGVSDSNGSFKMFLDPPIFMIENPSYTERMETTVSRELKVMTSFLQWQNLWMKHNPQVILEIKRKEGALLAEKEEEKRIAREAEEKRLEDEAEARRLEKMKVIGPAERWQMIVQSLIEKTIAVKKRINRAELYEHERPLRELEAQRLEKERRMFQIMKCQKTIFNDTVAILFPEAIKKEEKVKKSLLSDNKEKLKIEYLEDYDYLKKNAFRMVLDNPYQVHFSWDATLQEGKERRQALDIENDFVKFHKLRLDMETDVHVPKKTKKSYVSLIDDEVST